MTTLSGRSLIGLRQGGGLGPELYATDPGTEQRLQPAFIPATAEEVELTVRLAAEAFDVYRHVSGRDRGAFLRKIAEKIEAKAGEVVERAMQETALAQARLQAETARTCGQLRLFAQVAEEGSWVNARIDHADPDRKPAPKPDIRSMLRPLGPVVVFGASNFPLAFSVAGGDTASALAAGNTVIVKAHAAHPGTSELVGRAVQESVRDCGLPEGVFSMLFGSGSQIGTALMKHPLVRAGGFTGSRAAGRTLMDLAAARPEPIPFYAEMSSTNPVFILPRALRDQAENLAAGLHASFTLGAGQFCTKPGMVFLPRAPNADLFSSKLCQLVSASAPYHLLTKAIHSSYRSAIAARKADRSVTLVAEAPNAAADGYAVNSAIFEADPVSFLNSDLDAEIFGPLDTSREALQPGAVAGNCQVARRSPDGDDPWYRRGLAGLCRPDRDSRKQGRPYGFQRVSDWSGSYACDGAWRPLSIYVRWALHVSGKPGDFPVHTIGLLSGVSR